MKKERTPLKSSSLFYFKMQSTVLLLHLLDHDLYAGDRCVLGEDGIAFCVDPG